MTIILDVTLLENTDAAPRFSHEFSVADYLTHINTSNSTLLPKPLSLYVHIPFFQSPCAYLNYLYREIELLSPYLAQDRLVTQIYFASCSSGYLDSAQCREILDVIARNFHLNYPEGLEISMGADSQHESFAGTDQIGLGVSAISQIGDAYIQNDRSLKNYYNSLDKDQLPIERGTI